MDMYRHLNYYRKKKKKRREKRGKGAITPMDNFDKDLIKSSITFYFRATLDKQNGQIDKTKWCWGKMHSFRKEKWPHSSFLNKSTEEKKNCVSSKTFSVDPPLFSPFPLCVYAFTVHRYDIMCSLWAHGMPPSLLLYKRGLEAHISLLYYLFLINFYPYITD